MSFESEAEETSTRFEGQLEYEKIYCPSLLHFNYCRYAKWNRCQFSHSEHSIKSPNDYCPFMWTRQCYYGPGCRLVHLDTSNKSTSCCTILIPDDKLNGPDQPIDLNEPLLAPAGQQSWAVDVPRDFKLRHDFFYHHDTLTPCQRLEFYLVSKDKECGICLEEVVQKKPYPDSRFGLLENCNHVFCVDCLSKWRGSRRRGEGSICPECRVASNLAVATVYWFKDGPEKKDFFNFNSRPPSNVSSNNEEATSMDAGHPYAREIPLVPLEICQSNSSTPNSSRSFPYRKIFELIFLVILLVILYLARSQSN